MLCLAAVGLFAALAGIGCGGDSADEATAVELPLSLNPPIHRTDPSDPVMKMTS